MRIGKSIFHDNIEVDFSQESKLMTDEQAQALARVALAAHRAERKWKDTIPKVMRTLWDEIGSLDKVGVSDEYMKCLKDQVNEMYGFWRAWGCEALITSLAEEFYEMNHPETNDKKEVRDGE